MMSALVGFLSGLYRFLGPNRAVFRALQQKRKRLIYHVADESIEVPLG